MKTLFNRPIRVKIIFTDAKAADIRLILEDIEKIKNLYPDMKIEAEITNQV